MALEVFERALDQARAQLREIEDRFRELGEERERLRDVIESLCELIGKNAQTDALEEKEREEPDGSDDPRNIVAAWNYARGALVRFGRPMSVPQIASILGHEGIHVSRDSLRVAMSRKDDVFQ